MLLLITNEALESQILFKNLTATALRTDFRLFTPFPIPTVSTEDVLEHPSLQHGLLQASSELSSPHGLPYEIQKPGSACHLSYSFCL